jgi:hypothetical protein
MKHVTFACPVMIREIFMTAGDIAAWWVGRGGPLANLDAPPKGWSRR